MLNKLAVAAAFTVLGSSAAMAQVSIGVNIGIGRPVYGYVEPYPVYAPPVAIFAPEPRVVIVPSHPVYIAPPPVYYVRPAPRGRAVGHYKHYYKQPKHYYKSRGRGNWD